MTAPDEDPDMLAAELALGVLDGPERADALRRVLAEPDFAREVDWWRARLAAMFADWPEVEPGPDMARRIAAIPDGGRAPGHGTGGRWRWVAAVSSIAAALLLGILVLRPQPTPVAPAPVIRSAPALVAVIKPEQGDPFGAVFDPATREVRLSGAVAIPAGRDAELWTIGGDGVPHAAGLLRGGGARLTLANHLTVGAGTTLAISIEPVGGSPKPTPTGPVVATGTLARI